MTIFTVASKTDVFSLVWRMFFTFLSDERSATNGNDEMAITWDDELAKLAQGLTDTCGYNYANMEVRTFVHM